ncbi:CPBP family intramembrane glutamic endopeptidase [Dyadobacter sp. CY356]|uniref:CPBP family intramembrane glutamic endopeptidase n=1 Tax=Dyadobacter sp. CY356 TaxID=2906442 RepID=UPI001F2C0525|nr:CPBP family intramembrane glutamic endopeptidase [Dyadobacter sp. CY356]MCF0054164.1 CPBP family intramembrane metalloprotease [Dyadobacter sp. CY356]
MIQDIATFYRNPYACFQVGDRESIKERMVALRKTYFFSLYAAVMIILIIVIVDGVLKNTLNISIYENLHKLRDEFRKANSPVDSFLKVCLIGPFVEESIFRLPLLTRSLLSRCTIFFVFILYFFSELFHLEISFWLYNSILVLIFGGIIVFNRSSAKISTPILGAKNYNYLCWGLTVAFALLHIANFIPLNGTVFYLYPIYVLPQFVYGIIFSYLAIRYNSIVWSFLLHAAINSTSEVHKLLTDVF